MLGGMQDWPLRVMRILDHAEREHGSREIVSLWADHSQTRTTYAGIARDARRLAAALTRLGLKKGDRVATLAMNHGRHMAAWYGAIGAGGVIHTINPRLFDEQLVYIANHAEDRVLFYDAAFAPIVERLRPRWTSIEHYVCFDPPAGEAGFEELIAAENGRPQAAAWNIGTIGSTTERAERSNTSGPTSHIAWRTVERCS